MRLLDLFCGAGGAAVGYHRAGFEIIGIDLAPQPNYPFEFIQADACDSEQWPWGIDAIHASPPCQSYSTLASLALQERPMLVEHTRALLQNSGLPYVIENVQGAPLKNPVMLCGSSFGLRVWRHRLFELSFPPPMIPPCSHQQHPEPLDVTGSGRAPVNERKTLNGGQSRKPRNLREAGEAMGIDWMSRAELAEAIPPVYTEFLGEHLRAAIPLHSA